MGKKVLAILGSPHEKGSTAKMLQYAMEAAKKQGDEVQFINLYASHLEFCKGCMACLKVKQLIYLVKAEGFIE